MGDMLCYNDAVVSIGGPGPSMEYQSVLASLYMMSQPRHFLIAKRPNGLVFQRRRVGECTSF